MASEPGRRSARPARAGVLASSGPTCELAGKCTLGLQPLLSKSPPTLPTCMFERSTILLWVQMVILDMEKGENIFWISIFCVARSSSMQQPLTWCAVWPSRLQSLAYCIIIIIVTGRVENNHWPAIMMTDRVEYNYWSASALLICGQFICLVSMLCCSCMRGCMRGCEGHTFHQ